MAKYTQPLWFAQNSGDTRYQVSDNERPPNWDERSNHSKMIGLSMEVGRLLRAKDTAKYDPSSGLC